ncbi:MAG: Guanine deaminase [candidate division TM6 bacterium GW2011_GWF2_37_49]|nr:MAG: Guanine deaminase [candidate division TM6 bacterium GW2011_GWF2_37_49]
MNENDNKFMLAAIDLSINSVKNNGGPFGAVIVKNGEIISKTSNSVTIDNDPTAHAEINAIRSACCTLKLFDLSGCTIYSSCEPCPMCLGAIYWARIDKIFYANSRTDAKNIGFSDSFIYDELNKVMSERSIPAIQIMQNEAIKAFKDWKQKFDKTEY